MKLKNTNLNEAKSVKNDEFYTQFEDIANELKHYTQHFQDKVVYCNCDNPTRSAFWRYFHINFEHFGLKKLISTHYDTDNPTYKMEYTGGNDNDVEVGIITPLEGDGDFRSQECIELLNESDIVVTNPPYSKFREFVAQLVEHGKKFIIIGNPNAVTYKEFFPLFKNNLVWLGAKSWFTEMYFGVPKEQEEYLVAHKKKGSGYVVKDGRILGRAASLWFTNLDIQKRHKKLILCKKYYPEEYPKYDNYDAINVDKVSEIPIDYIPCWYDCHHKSVCEYAKREGCGDAIAYCETEQYRPTTKQTTRFKCNGIMGVPITFLDKYNPEQFEIVGKFNHGFPEPYDFAKPMLGGKWLYKRLAIVAKRQRCDGNSDNLLDK